MIKFKNMEKGPEKPTTKLESFSIFEEQLKVEKARIEMLKAQIAAFQKSKKQSAGHPELIARIQGEIGALEKELGAVQHRAKVSQFRDDNTAEFIDNFEPDEMPQA